MSAIPTGERDFSDGETTVQLTNADWNDAVMALAADPNDDDGRSQFVWIRFPNGDLFLAVAPQGDTYFALEATQ